MYYFNIDNLSTEEVESLLTGAHEVSEDKNSEQISLKDNDVVKSKHCSLSFPKYMRFLFLILDKIELDGTVSLTQKELGEELGCSRATINSYIKKLKEIGFLENESKRGTCKLTPLGIVRGATYRYMEYYLRDIMYEEQYDNNKFRPVSYERGKRKDYEYNYKVKFYWILCGMGYRWGYFENKYGDLYKKRMELENKKHFCVHCGSEVKYSWVYCQNCGENWWSEDKE
jgi:DNA-binding Lrp family transcriptional regulator